MRAVVGRTASAMFLVSTVLLTACGADEPVDEGVPGAGLSAPTPVNPDPAQPVPPAPGTTPASSGSAAPTATGQDFCQNLRDALAARPAVGGSAAEMEQGGRRFVEAMEPVVRTAPEATRNFFQAVEQVARSAVNDGGATVSADEARRLLVREAPAAVAEVARTCNMSAGDLSALTR